MTIIWKGWAKPDDPIYKMGPVISVVNFKPSLKATEKRQETKTASSKTSRARAELMTPEEARALGIPESVLVLSPRSVKPSGKSPPDKTSAFPHGLRNTKGKPDSPPK